MGSERWQPRTDSETMKIVFFPTLNCRTRLILITVVVTGCSGINASRSISPLDFLMPGLLQNCSPLPVSPIQAPRHLTPQI